MDPIIVYEQAADLITREIEKIINKGTIDKDALCLIGQAIDIQKDLETLKAMYNEYGTSSAPYRGMRHSYDTHPYHNDWRNDRGMSGNHNSDLIYKLENAMNTVQDRAARDAIRMALEKLEKVD